MPTNFQDNLLKRKEIHVNPNLWRDKIYYLEHNPYWNKTYDFIPTPKKYAEIIQEFHNEIDKQKQQVEKVVADKKEAEQRIKEIRQELKELVETILANYGEPTEENQELIKTFNQPLRFILFKQWKKWVEDNFPEEEIVEDILQIEPARLTITEHGEPELPEKELNQQIEVREKIAPRAIKELVKEWEEQIKKIQADYNSCFILEHDEANLVFTFQPPRQIFVNLNEFLFYRNNTWYEVVSWRRINSWNAIIITKRSVFLSYYHYFLAKGANGIMHASPRIAREICQCPSFLESNQVEEYSCDWEPHYELWRIGSSQTIRTTQRDPLTSLLLNPLASISGRRNDNPAPYISAVSLEPAEYINSFDSLRDTTYLLLPKGYNDNQTWWSNSSSALGNKITFSERQRGIFNEENWQKNTTNELNEHTKFHVSIQFFWRKKILGKYTLADFDPSNCYLKVKANGSSILYTLQSKNIWVRWSEDVKTTIEKDKMVGIISGVVQKFTGVSLKDATSELFHDLNTEESKSQDERESERRTKYDGTAQVVSSVMGSLPSMLATSHTKHDYTSAEFALRYEQPSLKIRIQYNNNIFDRYKMEKQLKRNGNEWFNWERIGNYLNKGYWKIVPHIFEFDKDNFFANIFRKGVYLYEEHPHEYFTTKLTGGKYTNNVLVGGNPQVETIFRKDLEETGGHDNLSQAGGGLWVHKTSYIKRKDGTGGNLLETLFNKAYSYRNHSYEDSNKWVFRHPQTWNVQLDSNDGLDQYALYSYQLNFFSSDKDNPVGIKGATQIIAQQISSGNRSEIKIKFIGDLEIKIGQDDPNEIGTTLPGSGGTEQMPEIPKEQNDETIDSLEKMSQPEAEQQNQNDKEILDELENQEELQNEPQKQDEKQEELEQEDEQSRERQKQRQQQQQKQQEETKQKDEEENIERSNEK